MLVRLWYPLDLSYNFISKQKGRPISGRLFYFLFPLRGQGRVRPLVHRGEPMLKPMSKSKYLYLP